MNFYGR